MATQPTTPGSRRRQTKVRITEKLVSDLTMAVKRHLLDNGGEPAKINTEVIRSALLDYNDDCERND